MPPKRKKDEMTPDMVYKEILAKLDATMRRLRAPPKPVTSTPAVLVSDTKVAFARDMGYEVLPWVPSVVARTKREKTVVNPFVAELCRICREKIPFDYIEGLVDPMKNKVLETNRRFPNPWRYFAIPNKAFAIGRFLGHALFGDNIFFIELICSCREKSVDVTGAIFAKIEAVARQHNCGKIWLAAVEEAALAYRIRGFEFGPVCEHDTAYPPGAQVVSRPLWGPKDNLNRLLSPILPSRLFRIKHLGVKGGNHVNSDPDDYTYIMTKCLHYGASTSKSR
jgi:hypothetical protein